MASGDIKQSGMWKCVNDRDGTVYKTGGYWPYSIYYSEYSNGVTLVDYDSTKCSEDPIEWIEYNYNGKTVYIQNKLFFYSISIAESLRLCSNNGIYIDNVKYKLSFMPKEFWTNLPSSICTLFKTDTSKKFYTNSPFYTDSTSHYYSVSFNGSNFSFDSESIGVDTIDENYAFVPVLVQDNNFNVGDIVRFGRWKLTSDSGDITYLVENSVDYTLYNKIEIDTNYTGNDALGWFVYKINNKKVYISNEAGINWITLNEAKNFCNKIVEINNEKYTYTLMSVGQWTSIRKTYVHLCFFIPETHEILTSSTKTVSVKENAFVENTTTYAEDNKRYGFLYYIPVLTQVTEQVTEDGTIVEMGMTHDSYNGYNNFSSVETIYPAGGGFTRTYVIDDASIIESLRIMDYNSSYTDDSPMEWVTYNYQNKLHYISRTIFIWGNIQYSFDMCNNNKTIYLNGKYYEMTTMPIEFWTSLPSNIKNNMQIINYKMHTNSEVQVSTSEGGLQTGYRTVSFDTNSVEFVEDEPAFPETIREGNYGFIPVLVEKYSDLNIVKMGTWRLLPKDTAEIDQYASYYSKGTCYMDNYKYVQLRDRNSYSGDAVAEMVEYIYNGEKLYIPLFAALRCTNEEANRIVRGCFFDLNDDEVYVGRYMPKDFWINLPSEIMSLVINGINSDGRIIGDGYLLGIDEYSNTTDKIHKAVAYNKTNNRFEESNSTLSNTQPCCICIPVMGPYTKYEVTRMGILKDSSTGKTYNQKDIISNVSTKPYLSYDKITFVDTDNKSEQWKWIKHVYNNEIYYICTSLCASGFGNSDLSNISKREIVFGNGKFKFCGLSPYKGNTTFLYSTDFLEDDMAYFLKPPGESIRLYGTGTSSGSDSYYFRDIEDYYIGFSSYTTSWPGHGEQTGNYFPILKLLNAAPTISGTDSNLGDKTQAFLIEYTVDDTDSGDTLTVTEKLNGTTIRTINSAVRNQKYYFDITSSMFANLVLYETNTVEITVNDGIATATRTYTFRKTNTAPVINYTGSDNLGIINSKPTIRYTVTDAEGDEITITERLNGKVLQTYTVSSGTECTVNIPNMSWLGCGNTVSTIEINARDSAGGSSNKTITFTRAIDRIEVITNPIKTDKAVTKISLEVGWNTENASGQVFVCNNAYDASPTWENMTNSVGSNLVYNLTNTTKTAAEWGVSVKVIVKKDGGSTGEVSLYSIKGTYE